MFESRYYTTKLRKKKWFYSIKHHVTNSSRMHLWGYSLAQWIRTNVMVCCAKNTMFMNNLRVGDFREFRDV